MPIYQGHTKGFPSWSVDIKINVQFAILPSNGVRTVKRQNGNSKRRSSVSMFKPQRACGTPTFSDWTTVQYESSEAHFDTL